MQVELIYIVKAKHCVELPRLPRTVVEQYKHVIDLSTD